MAFACSACQGACFPHDAWVCEAPALGRPWHAPRIVIDARNGRGSFRRGRGGGPALVMSARRLRGSATTARFARARAFHVHERGVVPALAQLGPILTFDVLVGAQARHPIFLGTQAAPAARLLAMLRHEAPIAQALPIALPRLAVRQQIVARIGAEIARALALFQHELRVGCTRRKPNSHGQCGKARAGAGAAGSLSGRAVRCIIIGTDLGTGHSRPTWRSPPFCDACLHTERRRRRCLSLPAHIGHTHGDSSWTCSRHSKCRSRPLPTPSMPPPHPRRAPPHKDRTSARSAPSCTWRSTA